jgi:hypothetical protein
MKIGAKFGLILILGISATMSIVMLRRNHHQADDSAATTPVTNTPGSSSVLGETVLKETPPGGFGGRPIVLSPAAPPTAGTALDPPDARLPDRLRPGPTPTVEDRYATAAAVRETASALLQPPRPDADTPNDASPDGPAASIAERPSSELPR